MKQKLHRLAIMLLMCICFTANAQEEVSTVFYEEQVLRFGQLDPTKVPTGILYDAGFPFTDIETFNGTELPDSLYVNGGTVKSIYKTIFSSILDEYNEGIATLQYPDEYEDDWFAARNPDEVILSGMLFKYNLFKEDAYQQEQIMVNSSGALIDVPGQNPYTEDYTIGIAPGFTVFYGKEMNVKLPSSLFKSNLLEQIENIEIDFGDGLGFRTVTFNQPVAVTYATAGDKEWRYRISLSSSLVLDSRSVIDIVDWTDPIPIVANNYCSSFNSVKKITATKAHLGEYGELNLTIRCSGDGIINNPLIVVEGFDIGNLFDPESKYGTTNIESFRNSLYESTALTSLLENSSRQYDIIYVDWINGMDYLERNAYALQEAINWVNSIKQGNEPNVIIGQSMGGVITRYALTDMENNSEAHETNLFVSHDAPHDGAYIPDGYQFMYRHFSNMTIQVRSGISRVFDFDIVPSKFRNQLNGITGLLDQPAAKQLLRFWIGSDYSYDNHTHWNFYSNLRGMNSNEGYPAMTRNIAISNGSECGSPQQGVQKGGNLFYLHYSNKPTILSDVVGGIVGPIAGAFGAYVSKDWNVFLTGLLSPLSSRKKLTVEVYAKAMKDSGLQQHVYHAKMGYQQNFLWVIPQRLEIFEKDLDARSGNGYESYGGGNYQLYDDTDSLEVVKYNRSGDLTMSLAPRFNFIPTYSGLDAKTKGTLGFNILTHSYVGAYQPSNSYSQPYDNFSSEFNPTNANHHNYRHITFNPRNGKWLAEELNAARNSTSNQIYTDCSYFCDGIEISGLDFICDSGNYVYSYPEIDGATYTWSANGLDIVSGQTTANVTVKVNGAINPTTLTLNISTPDCGMRTFTKNVHSGLPIMSGPISGETHIHLYNNTDFSVPKGYSIPPAIGATHYEWDFTGSYNVVNEFGSPMDIPNTWEFREETTHTNQLVVRTDNYTNGTISVRACNDCGCTGYLTLDVQHVYYNMPGHVIAPNPANDMLNILLAEGAPVPDFIGGRTNVRVYNLQSHLVHEFEIYNEGGSTNITHLPVGFYKVQIDMQNDTFQVLNLLIER